MQRQRKGAGTPNRQVQSARAGRPAKPIVTQPGDLRSCQRRRRYEEQLSRNFKCGLWTGLAIGFGVMALIMWLWAVPTVDGCVQNMQRMQEQMLQQGSAVLA